MLYLKRVLPNSQSAAPTTQEKDNKGGLKFKEAIVLAGVVFAFILAINKIESSMFEQVFWVGCCLLGGPAVGAIINDRLPTLKLPKKERT